MAFEVVLSTPGNPNFTESGSATLLEDWAIVLQTVILTITTLLVIVGNALCFIVLLRSRDIINEVTRLCMLFLTATDAGIGVLICVPITGATAVDRWPYGDAFCLVIAGSTFTMLSMSSVFVLAVNVERFVAIVWPLRSTTYITIPRVRNGLMLILAMGVMFAVLYCFLPGRSAVYHPRYHTCFMDPDDVSKPDIMGMIAAWIFCIVPFLITLLLYSRLYRIARRHARQISVMEGVPNRRGIKRSDLKTATTFFIITAVLALSWLPIAVVICYAELTRFEVHPAAVFIAEILVLSNSYWNILIYCFRDAKFRRAGTKFVQDCLCRACRQSSRGEDIGVNRTNTKSPSSKANVVLTSHI